MNNCLVCGVKTKNKKYCSCICYNKIPRSEEHKNKLSMSQKGRVNVGNKYAVGSKAKLGQTLTDETKRKIGYANRKKIRTPEQKQHLKEISTSRKYSEESRKKHSISIKKRYEDPIWAEEQRQKH